MRDPDTSTQMTAKRLRFGGYVLDVDRGCLLRQGAEVVLRPKTFAVLQYLVENAGRLVSKDELFATVWPKVVTTDDALVQSIGELRRALGEDGPRLIRTVPRRGYRFEGAVFSIPATDDSCAGITQPAAAITPALSPDPADPGASSLQLLTRTFTGRSIAWTAALALASLLAAGALWMRAGEPPESVAVRASAKPAIAVLPLVDHSDEPGREYFADGLTQDLIHALGRFSALTVLSWSAVSPYKGKPASPGEIGRRLGVRYLVEGSARQLGDRVRVTAQLVETGQGRVLWSARFDEPLADVFALQDRITAQVVRTLAIRVTQIEQRRAFAIPTANLEAYDSVLRARPALQRPTRAGIVEARVLLRRAIELDPSYAAAYAALAETFYLAVAMGWAESPTAFMERAETLALQALSLDDAEVRARVILSRIHVFHQRYAQAESEIERAIAVNPNDAQALAGRGNILMWLGRTDGAIEALEQAQRIDPELNAMDRFALSLTYYLKRRYEAAIEQSKLNLRDNPAAHFSRIVLAAAYAQHSRPADAARVAASIRTEDPTFDAAEFGTKFLNPVDLAHVRDGLRKAGLE